MKLSKEDREFAVSVFYAHFRSLAYGDNEGILVKAMHRSLFFLSERLRPIVIRLIDRQYEQDLSINSCLNALEKIAAETVE